MNRTIARLKRRLKRNGITQDQIATAVGVTRPMVNHVLNGRAKSAKVVAVAERLMLEAELARVGQQEGAA